MISMLIITIFQKILSPLWFRRLRTLLVSMKMQVQSLASLSGLRIGIAKSCSMGHRSSSDLALLRLWGRPAAATPIRTLTYELLYAVGAVLKKKKKAKKIKNIFFPLCIPMQKCMCPFARNDYWCGSSWGAEVSKVVLGDGYTWESTVGL